MAVCPRKLNGLGNEGAVEVEAEGAVEVEGVEVEGVEGVCAVLVVAGAVEAEPPPSKIDQ